MSSWFYKVTYDLSNIPDCMEYFESEFQEARKEVEIRGKLEEIGAKLPGHMEFRYNQLQELEAILEHLNIEYRKTKGMEFRKYLERHNRALSSRDAEKYAEGEVTVVNIAMLVNEVAFMRNKFLGITKGLESKNWMISNLVKLRSAGLDDAMI